MQNRIAVLHCSPNTMGITDITSKDLKLAFNLQRAGVQPPPRIDGVVLDESPHVVAERYQTLNQMGTNKTICTCN